MIAPNAIILFRGRAGAHLPHAVCTASQTFQKLIFISGLVFGDQKSAFLLPWKRVFNMTDSQVTVAKRDSAKALFKTFLDARGGHLQVPIPISVDSFNYCLSCVKTTRSDATSVHHAKHA